MFQIPKICIALSIYYFLLVQRSVAAANARTEIDISSDIPQNGHWTFDCALGYAENLTEFNCDNGDVFIPPVNLQGEIGFWTRCASRCRISYRIQPNDRRFTMRLYQSQLETEVIYNSERSEFIRGNGWVYYSIDIAGKQEIAILLNHLAPDMFTLMDQILVE